MKRFIPDITSGFLVFLIALPLCLGIAMASGFPPIAGVLTAIIGGLLTSHIGSAPLTIKGPAAGLIVIALGAVQELGEGDAMLGYKRALAVGVVAAVVQIGFALFKAGRFASVMPPAVVHGMLAAIGVIIIAKQAPIVLGVLGAHGEPLEMLAEIPHYFSEANPYVAGIGALSVLILVALPRLPIPGIKAVPAPLVVLIAALPLATYLGFSEAHSYLFSGEAFSIGPNLLVALSGSLLDAITLPDFSVIASGVSIKYVVMFALVGVVESLLSVIAVDAMDPEKRSSDLDRDLLVTGLGNLAASMIGGLPMISEIVRSKANVDAGAKGPWSNFFHGAFLLLFVVAFPGLLQMIPLAALAAMLVVTGARLAHPKEFVHMWHVGKDQFALFFVTFGVTLATDLLIGVGVGLVLKVAMHVARSGDVTHLFQSSVQLQGSAGVVNVSVTGPLAFTNFLSLRTQLAAAVTDETQEVRINLHSATILDHTVQERLAGMANEWRNAKLVFEELDQLKTASHDPHAFRQST